jgi:hypothetical protein
MTITFAFGAAALIAVYVLVRVGCKAEIEAERLFRRDE